MMTFQQSVLATLVMFNLSASFVGARQRHLLRRELGTDDEIALNYTEVPPHNGCELMLKDQKPPQPMLVGEDFEKITTTDYMVENEVGSTSAVCRSGMAGGYPCQNVDLLSMLDNGALSVSIGGGKQKTNDIWGWTHNESKREFALIGLQKGTAFVEITDPINPIYVGGLPTQGNGSLWRDIKNVDHYAVIVSEEPFHGMQIFDLKQLLDASPGTTFSNTVRYTEIGSAHNVFVNEDTKYAYVVGQSGCQGGLHMVDLTNPRQPIFAGCYSNDGYTHDVQCVTYDGPDTSYIEREICFASNEDTVTIVDVSDKKNPIEISKTGYDARYTHQGWLTEDHSHFIFNDELDEYRLNVETSTHLMDVTSLERPIYKGIWKGRTKAIDHNNYVLGNYVYQANYQAGLNILKIKDIESTKFEESGYFDIYPSGDSNKFNGAWSNYPYFSSGTIIVSGIEQGLFMLKFNKGGSLFIREKKPLVDYGMDAHENGPLGICEGDCDNDSHCAEGLKCFQSTEGDDVAFCEGKAELNFSYCITPPLGLCGGDCNDDSDCALGLKCFKRTGDEAIPGCPGEAVDGVSYCSYPVLQDSGKDAHKNGPIGLCEGDCDRNLQCEERLRCFKRGRFSSAPVPGCVGEDSVRKGYDFCTYPLLVDYGDDVYDEKGFLDLCEGNCNDDTQCAEGLVCFHNNFSETNMPIPGCSGEPLPNHKYCTYPTLRDSGSDDDSESLDLCEGNCDDDSDCADGLQCYLDGQVNVPGCNGDIETFRTSGKTYDFCTYPLIRDSGINAHWFGALGLCEGDCDKDDHCARDLICFRREKHEHVPGCAGLAHYGHDYCIEPSIKN